MTRYNQSALFRDGANPMISGVCSGLAKYLNVNPIWTRTGAVVSFLVFPFAMALAYVLAVLLLRKRLY
jgi:phage shock protein PspC (stress-responsive transcriptional regulator)